MKIKTLMFILLVSYSLMEDKKTFGVTKVLSKSCNEGKYEIVLSGKSDTITSEIKWNATFSSPSNPTVSCVTPVPDSKASSAEIKCTITSDIDKKDVILTKLTADGFNDIELSNDLKTIATAVECKSNASSFISFTKLLLLFVFILF